MRSRGHGDWESGELMSDARGTPGTKAGRVGPTLVQVQPQISIQSHHPALEPSGVSPALPFLCLINNPLSPSHRHPDSTTPPVYTTVPFSPATQPTIRALPRRTHSSSSPPVLYIPPSHETGFHEQQSCDHACRRQQCNSYLGAQHPLGIVRSMRRLGPKAKRR